MKMRKLFAGIAAAATLLGGMALGATSAQADGAGTIVTDTANFTFTAQDAKQLTNRSLNAYKIADYVQYGTGDNATYGVQTADGVNRGTLKAALESATGKTVSETGDLMAWALAEGVLSVDNSADGAWNNSASRKFVESLKTTTDKLGTVQKVDLGAVANGTSATVQLPAGLYLFVDADYLVGTNGAATPSIAILVGSGNVENGVLNPLTAATVDIKNQTTTVSKTVSAATASVGQTVTYTITSKVPQNTQYYSDYAYTYTDTPSAGQTVHLDSLKVTVGGSDLNKGKDYTVAEGENGKFTVNITSIKQQNAGDEIVVTYDAEVTEAEATGRKAVTNTVVLSDNGAKATDSTSITNGQFSFTKTDAQAKKGVLQMSGCICREGDRCLQCSTVCENCVDSCPNRANVAISMADGSHQILHVDKMCNECGNCTQFCPYASEPCHDKFTLFQTAEDMVDSKNAGVLFLGGDMVRVRTFGEPKDYDLSRDNDLPADLEKLIVTLRDKYGYLYL